MAGIKGTSRGMKNPVATQTNLPGGATRTTIDGGRSKAKKMKPTVSTGFKAKPSKKRGGRKPKMGY